MKNKRQSAGFKMSRITVIVLTLCMLAVGLFTMGIPAGAASANKSIMAGADHIPGYSSTNGYHYIYIGEEGISATRNPIKWRVLDSKTNTGEEGLFVLTERLDNYYYFNKYNANNHYFQGSDAQRKCKEYLNDELEKEKDVFLATTKSDAAYTTVSEKNISTIAQTNILNGDKLFFLSAEEADNPAYGFTDAASRVAYVRGQPESDVYLLRSASTKDSTTVAVIWTDGDIFENWIKNGFEFRHAANLDKSKIIFTSAATGGKTATGSTPSTISSYSGNEWKLTIKDTTHSSFSATLASYKNNIIGVSYTGAVVGDNEYISVVIKDNTSGQYTHYSRVQNVTAASGTAEINLSGLNLTNKTVYVFNEQCNGDLRSDLSSELIQVYPVITDKALFNIEEFDTTPVYNGNPYTRQISVKSEFSQITASDYTVSYENNVNAGTATMTVKGKNKLSGQIQYSWLIDKAEPVVTWPKGLTGVAGNRLITVSVESGFSWSANYLLECGEQEYSLTYTPSDTKNYKKLTNKIKVDVQHSFGIPTYEWNEDHTVCTATRVCAANSEHTEVEDGVIQSAVTRQQSCVNDELTTFTATFTNPAFEGDVKADIVTKERLGHDFISGTEYKKESTGHSKKCSRCDTYDTEAPHSPETDDNNCLTERLCTVCLYAVEEERLSHSWSDTYLLSDADEGRHYHVCTVSTCTAKDGGEDHTPNEDDGSCITDVLCSVCSYVTTPKNEAHDFSGQLLKDAAGHWHKCGNCTVTDEKQEHDTPVDDGDCTTAVLCTCGELLIEAKAAHTGGTATCTEKAKCEVCEKAYGDTLGHDFSVSEQSETEHRKKCSRCGVTDTPVAHSYEDGFCSCGREKPGPSGGAVAGIVGGSVGGLGIISFAVYWFIIKRKIV